MRIISFRDRVDLPDLLSWNYELWNGDLDGQICFDFKNVKFLTPSAMLFIAHQIRFLQAIRPSTRLQMSQYKHLGYAGHMGFFACFGASFGKAVGEALGDINYLPITELVTKDFLNSKGNTGINESIDLESSRLARVLTRLGSGYTYDIVHYALREIMRNVFEHSGSKNLMYCGQYWPSRQRVEIVLADEGMGVADSLRYNPKFKGLSERDALHFSCMPGVSGNFRALRGEGPMSVWTNSGYGLYMTSRLCRNVGGFQLFSSNRVLVLSRGRKLDYSVTNFRGTMIKLSLEIRSEENLRSRLETYSQEGKDIARGISGAKVLDASTASQMLSRDFMPTLRAPAS